MNENEYIEKWVEKSITLAEWLSARNIDHWEWISQFDLSESEIEEIEDHQNYLFNQAVKNSVNNRIESYPEVVKINVFTEQLRLLELFLASTKVEPFLIELLKPIVRIRDKDYLYILVEYQNIRGRRYNDFKKDFSINQQGSFLNGYFFTASIIWEYKTEIQKYLIKVSPQQPEAETEQETLTFTNTFDNIKPAEIYKHFKAGLVEKGYLTEQELNAYLKAAFELQTKPETLFKLKHTPAKQKIYTVFYIYYKDISQKKHARQKEYAALLGDFFEGYNTEIIQTNWARDYKTKR
jgi:hypothetical protein